MHVITQCLVVHSVQRMVSLVKVRSRPVAAVSARTSATVLEYVLACAAKMPELSIIHNVMSSGYAVNKHSNSR